MTNETGVRGGDDAAPVALYLLMALTLGGGGSPNPWAEVAVQLAAAVVAGWWVASGRRNVWRGAPAELRWLAALVLAVPLLHLLPLPPQLWQTLPARELVRGSLALVGAAERWRPLSVAPALTGASLLAMLPPAVLMLAAARLDRSGVRLCLLVVTGAALFSALLGAVQLASGAGYLYAETHRGWVTGVFANRNAAVDLLLIGSLAASAWVAGADAPRRLLPLHLAVQAVLLGAAVMTGSRGGILLIPLVLAAHGAIWWRSGRGWLRRSAILGGAAGFAVPAAALLHLHTRLNNVLARFGEEPGFRVELWRDGWQAALAYWPAGSGLGTFTRAFAPFERLEVVDATVPNRAHNDYLELLIEAGLLAPLVLAAAAVLLVRLARKAGGLRRPEAVFSLGTLLIIALHSLVDYPLRTMALASMAALAVGILASLLRERHKLGRIG